MSSNIFEGMVSGQLVILVGSNTVDLYAEQELVKISLQTITQGGVVVNTPFEMIIFILRFSHFFSRDAYAFSHFDKRLHDGIDAILFHHFNFSCCAFPEHQSVAASRFIKAIQALHCLSASGHKMLRYLVSLREGWPRESFIPA